MCMIKKEKFKISMATPYFAMHVPCTDYKKLIFLKKEQMILKPEKHYHKCTKEMNILPSK